MFERNGIPEELVSVNGPQFAAEEFNKFMRQNGIKLTRVPPYYPASNWAAERSVETAKVALTKQILDGKASALTLKHRQANFLILNRGTPHTVTGQSSARDRN